MSLKYQSEIDKLNLTECPNRAEKIKESIQVYRWSLSPIDHSDNFVPNVVFDRATKNPFNYNLIDPHEACMRCGASYFRNTDRAINRWNNLNQRIKKHMRYTHIAKGTIDPDDGLIVDDGEHLTLYEDELADLSLKFSLEIPL